MKKLSYLILGAAAFAMTSCSNEEVFSPNGDGTATVTLSLSTPKMQTRSYSDGKTATQLQYAVYVKNADGTLTLLPAHVHGTQAGAQNGAEEINLKKQVSFKLVTNRTYGFVFWASEATAPYTVTFSENGASMAVDYTQTINANNETLDAFYAYEEFTVTQDVQMDIDLYRPFAQINVGANDVQDAIKSGYTPDQSHINISDVYGTLNLINGAVSDKQDNVEFAYNTLPAASEKFPVAGYDYITMAYALVPAEKQTVEVSFDTKSESGEKAAVRTVGSVPVQRNYRTNIYGQLYTNNVDVYVEIIPIYNEPDYDVNLEGVEYDKESDTFTITSAEGLLWVSRAVGGFVTRAEGDGEALVKTAKYTYGAPNVAFVGQTVKLGCDIDLTGYDWYPIGFETKNDNGASQYAFAGTFDGCGYTIKNLTVPEGLLIAGNSNAGLFGATNRATIKNVNIENVNINSHYKTGAIVGDGYNARIENCHVKSGEILVTPWEIKPGVFDDANNVGGIVGYLIGQPEDAYVKDCSVEDLKITAFRKIGGIAGVATTADDANPHTSSVEISGCTVTNVTLIADMRETRYDKYPTREAEIGAIYGSRSNTEREELQANEGGATIEILGPVKVGASQVSQLKDGGDFYLTEDAKYPSNSYIPLTKSANINLGGHALSSYGNTGTGDAIVVGNGAEVTISNGTLNPSDKAKEDGSSATINLMTKDGGKLTLEDVTVIGDMYPVMMTSTSPSAEIIINSGNYYSLEKWDGEENKDKTVAVYVTSSVGHVTINGGTFGKDGVFSEFLLNVLDSSRNGRQPNEIIVVKGGTFINFDPSNNRAEGDGTNFVANGYTVVKEVKGINTYYTVVKE